MERIADSHRNQITEEMLRQPQNPRVAITLGRLALSELSELNIHSRTSQQGAGRRQFYKNPNPERQLPDVRRTILMRDLSRYTISVTELGEEIINGKLHCPYTNKVIHFTNESDIHGKVSVDHVVSLHNVWDAGAKDYSSRIRFDIARDPLNLLAVDWRANNQKSDSDASRWLPDNYAFWEQFVARQIAFKYKYNLSVTRNERVTMSDILAEFIFTAHQLGEAEQRI